METTIEDARVGHLVTLINGETMVETVIIVDRHLGMIVEPVMHGFLGGGADEVIGGRNVEQHGMGDGMLLTEQPVDPDAIIADRGIDIGARRSHVGDLAAHAEADQADLGHAGVPANPVDRRFDILDAQVEVMLHHVTDRFLELFGNV